MAYNDVMIANNALTIVGLSRIASLSENSEEARRINAIYTLSLDSLLAEFPWRFSTKRASLALLATTPEYDFDYMFQLPSDYLGIISRDYPDSAYRIEGNTLLCNEETINIKYKSRVTSSGSFPAHFCQALAHKLALNLVYSGTANIQLAQLVEKMAKQEIFKSKVIDSQQGNHVGEYTSSNWLDYRE